MKETAIERRDRKFRKALEAGARLAEISSSKLAWDIGHDKIEVLGNQLGYREHQVLDCAAYKIAQGHWFGCALGMHDKPNDKEPEWPIVVISYSEYVRFLNLKRRPNTKEAEETFRNMARIILDGRGFKLPFWTGKQWLEIKEAVGSFVFVFIASEKPKYDEYRSDRKLRGKGKGKEEPVYILLFTGPYGLAFFHNAMHRSGAQLQDPALYRLQPEAQMLYHSVRWKRGLIMMNTEQISKTVGWVWPPSNLRHRIYRIRRLLDILIKAEFINRPPKDEDFEHGGTWETKSWSFYTRKGRKALRLCERF